MTTDCRSPPPPPSAASCYSASSSAMMPAWPNSTRRGAMRFVRLIEPVETINKENRKRQGKTMTKGSSVKNVEILACDAGWRNYHFVKVTTDDGVVGWGEFDEGFGSAGLTGACT